MSHDTESNHGDSVTVRITVDDLLDLQQVSDAQIHPDGTTIAYVVAPNVADSGQQAIPSTLWLVDADRSSAHQISGEGTRAWHPRWSSDGTQLAFLGRRCDDDRDRIFILDNHWGEARRLACPALHDGDVSGFAWTAEGDSLIATIIDADEGAEARTESGRDWIEYEEHPLFTRLYRVDPLGGNATRISDLDLQVWEFAIAPDASRIAALVSGAPFNWAWYAARLVLFDLVSGEVMPLYAPDKQMTGLNWSPDGRSIALISCTWSDQGMTGGDVVIVDGDSGQATTITPGHERSYLSARWEDATRLLCAAIEDGESTIGYLSLDGEWEPRWREKASILRWGGQPFTMTRSENTTRLAAVIARPDAPPDVHIVEIRDDQFQWQRLTDANPTLREHSFPLIDTLHWESVDGTRIQGLLVRPVDVPEGPWPTIVLIHGGPTSLWSYEFHGTRSMGWVQLMAAEGYAVFLPNPRGSMGFGTPFAEANSGDMGGGDLADILSGVDYLVTEGIADPERVGVGGWSYGGYLTPLAITQTTRFKAAVSGASITNWVSFHGVSTIPAFDSGFYQVDPFNWDGHYGQFSPMAHVRNVTTPTLFLHGEQDPICPSGQALEMWRALTELGVETQAVIYPREGHGPREREHLRDVLERAVGWWKRRV